MNEDPTPTEMELLTARRRSRNRALGLVLASLAILFFAITLVKIAARSAGAN